jgi:hypothetical protein
VVSISRGIQNDQAFERMPVLADALEEAGCTEPAVLQHCREPTRHFLGCWVLDELLEKNKKRATK